MFKDAKIGDLVLVEKSVVRGLEVGSIYPIKNVEGGFVILTKYRKEGRIFRGYHGFYVESGFTCLDTGDSNIIPVSPAIKILYGV